MVPRKYRFLTIFIKRSNRFLTIKLYPNAVPNRTNKPDSWNYIYITTFSPSTSAHLFHIWPHSNGGKHALVIPFKKLPLAPLLYQTNKFYLLPSLTYRTVSYSNIRNSIWRVWLLWLLSKMIWLMIYSRIVRVIFYKSESWPLLSFSTAILCSPPYSLSTVFHLENFFNHNNNNNNFKSKYRLPITAKKYFSVILKLIE